MEDQIIIALGLLAFLVVGLVNTQPHDSSIRAFSLGKEVGWFRIAAGISMTLAGGASILNMASLGYSFKWYTLVDPFALFVGILVVILLLGVYRQDAGITIADLLSGNHKGLSVLVGLTTTIVYLLILAAQFVALSKLLAPVFGFMSPQLLTVVLSTAVFAYVYRGGFRSVTRTDVLQLVVIAFCLLLPMAYLAISGLDLKIDSQDYSHDFASMPVNLIILLAIPVIFIPLSPDINIRVKSAKSDRDARVGLFVGVLIYAMIIIASSLSGITLGVENIKLVDPEQAFTVFFQTALPGVGVLAILAAFAAIVSSLDSYALNSITSVSKDLLPNAPVFREASEGTLIHISALMVFIIALMIALFFNQILTLILTSLLIYISVLAPIALARKLGTGDRAVFITALMVIATILVIEIAGWNMEPKALIYPVIGCAMMIASRMLCAMNKEDE